MNRFLYSCFIVVIGLFFLSGCTANLTNPEINFKPPAYVEQMPAKEQRQDFTATGSIFGQGENPLFSDHKAMHVNDIVTVVISETAKSSNTGTKQLSNVDSSKLGGGLFSKSGTPMGGVNGYSNIGFQTDSTRNFKGSGTAVKDASFTTTVSARVVKVLKNGNYFISGRREILIDNQKQLVQISGVIRPYDINQNNKISSSQISDAKILYKTEGDVDRATQQPWGTKIIQSIWPF